MQSFTLNVRLHLFTITIFMESSWLHAHSVWYFEQEQGKIRWCNHFVYPMIITGLSWLDQGFRELELARPGGIPSWKCVRTSSAHLPPALGHSPGTPPTAVVLCYRRYRLSGPDQCLKMSAPGNGSCSLWQACTSIPGSLMLLILRRILMRLMFLMLLSEVLMLLMRLTPCQARSRDPWFMNLFTAVKVCIRMLIRPRHIMTPLNNKGCKHSILSCCSSCAHYA